MLGRWAHRWPAYLVNGLTVSVGVGLVQLATSRLIEHDLAQAASVGAVLASLPHLTGRALPTLRRTLTGGLLGSLATFLVLLTTEHVYLRGFTLTALAFAALLGMSWGAKAAPIAFATLLGVIFSMARPLSGSALAVAGASAAGVALYAVWAALTAKLLEPRYRALAVWSALDAAAGLLRKRADVITTGGSEWTEDTDTTELGGVAQARLAQLSEEQRLARALQVARDLVYPAAARGAGRVEVALLARVAELRELVLTSRLDLELLGRDPAARFVRARLAVGLRRLSERLEQLARAQREQRTAELAALPAVALPDLSEAEQLVAGGARARLLPVVTARLRYLSEEVEAMRQILLGEEPRASLGAGDLLRFVVDDDTWPLAALRDHLTLASPVLRHALRSALALATAYALAIALPWATRPYWMLLSVVVVLRGTLDDTLSRRNARVLGTAIGCALVMAMVPIAPEPLLQLAFVAAVGLAHAFVNVRYLLTAIAGTVMALLQAHFVAPMATSLVIERLLDTVAGALLAWGFSYVLPSWERRALPAAVERALSALRDYARRTLELDEVRAEHRLMRQRAYDSLEVVAAALRRSAAEPRRVRPPVSELMTLLDHAQRLMAHLSSLRSLLQRRRAGLSPGAVRAELDGARAAIDARLSLQTSVAASAHPPTEQYLGELPGDPADRDPLPWLMRRLDACVYDAGVTGEGARRALRRLAREP